MKKFKILCITLLVFFFASMLQGFLSDFMSSLKVSSKMYDYKEKLGLESNDYIYLDLEADMNEFTPNAYNKVSGDSVFVIQNNVSVIEFNKKGESQSKLSAVIENIIVIINFLILAIYLYIVVLFVKIVFSFSRSQVFEPIVIKRFNRVGLWFVILGVGTSVWQFMRIYVSAAVVQLPDYSLSYRNCIDWNSLVIGLMVLVITEILRQATTIKEEQDLTI